MRRSLLAFTAALALLPTGCAPARILLDPQPHDPKLGCAAIRQAVANLNAGRTGGPKPYDFGPIFYSDEYGQVEPEEKAAFLHGLRHSEGKPDRKPIRLHHVSIVDKDEFEPFYLVVLEREAWHEKRLEDDGTGNVLEIDDPDYRTETSHWLVGFRSNYISYFREVPEMYKLSGKTPQLKHCDGSLVPSSQD